MQLGSNNGWIFLGWDDLIEKVFNRSLVVSSLGLGPSAKLQRRMLNNNSAYLNNIIITNLKPNLIGRC